MKLYTEEQVRNALKDAMLRGMRKPSKYESIVELMINDLTPIELPSDDEIYNKCSDWVFRLNPTKWSVNDDTAGDNMNSFAHGAKWMRDKIQGGNK